MLNLTAKENILKHLFGLTSYTMPAGVKVCLATAYNAGTGTYTEVTGGSYAPISVSSANFAARANKYEIENTAAVQFSSLPACTVTHTFLKDGSSNVIIGAALTTPRTVSAGDHVVFNAGNFVYGITDIN